MNRLSIFLKKSNVLPLIIPIIMLPLLIHWNIAHKTILENDGIIQIWIGKYLVTNSVYLGYGSDHWPFLTPFLLGISATITNPFIAGKLLSLVAVFFSVYAIYFVAYYLSSNKALALLAQCISATNGLLIAMSFYVDNHALDTSLIIISFAFLFKITSQTEVRNKYYFLLGLFSALALITRTNSIVFIITMILLLMVKRKLSLKNSLLIFSPIITMQLLSISLTYHSKGTLFPSSAYIFTLAQEIDPTLTSNPIGWFLATTKYQSLLQIIISNPYGLLDHLKTNILLSSKHIFIIAGSLKYILAAGFFFVFFQKRKLMWMSILLFYLGNLILISIFFFNIEFLLHFTLLNSLIISLPIKFLSELWPKKNSIILLLFAFLLSTLGYFSTSSMTKYFATRNSEELPHLEEVVSFLKNFDPKINEKFIMSKHQGYSYYLDSKFLPYMASYYDCRILDAATFQKFDMNLLKYLAIHPPITKDTNLKNLQADYLIYTNESISDVCDFSSYKESQFPKPVYKNSNVSVFKLR